MTGTYRIDAIALHEAGVFDDVRIDFALAFQGLCK